MVQGIFVDFCVSRINARGYSYMKRSRMLVGKFKVKPLKETTLELYLAALKQNKQGYEPLFRKGALASRPDSKNRPKSILKTQRRVLFL